jgi:hypothetical protein
MSGSFLENQARIGISVHLGGLPVRGQRVVSGVRALRSVEGAVHRRREARADEAWPLGHDALVDGVDNA